MDKKVSVIIPTKNRKSIIDKTINSVLSQSLKPFEVIVVDDGSDDGTEIFIKKEFPNIILIRNEVSVGGAKARNQGVAIAKGKYVAFLDSDDEWCNNHLERKIDLINREKSKGAFGAFTLVLKNKMVPITFKNASKIKKKNIGNLIFTSRNFDCRTSTFLFEKVAFMEIKFDEHLKKHQDWDFAINFSQKYDLVCDEESTVRIYIDHGSERMSNSLNHDATFYFLAKNQNYLNSNSVFIFILKQIAYSQFSNDKAIIKRYIKYVKDNLYSEIHIVNKVIYFLLKQGALNLGLFYRFFRRL